MTRRTNGNGAPPAPTRRCAVYTRKSTSAGLEQEFNSLDAQYEACEQYVASQDHLGWHLVPQRYDDGGFSGGTLERPGFQRLLADIDAGAIDVLVVYKIDRLSRSLLDFVRVMERLDAAGVAFVSVTQRFDTSDAMGKLTMNLLASFAEFEREMIRSRTKDKIAASRRRGKWTGGPIPFGYRVEDKRLVVEEHEAAVVRELFDLFLRHREVAAVVRELNTRGLVPRDGKRRTGNGAPRWNKTSVARILKSPIYAGLISSGDELHQGEHEAIIEREVWDEVQAILEGNARSTQYHGRNPKYLLRGVLRCALCNGAYTPASTRGKGGREYRYYRCTTRDKYGVKGCAAKPLPAGAIEDFVIDRIREATTDGSLANDIVTRLEQRTQRQRSILLAERRSLPAQIARLSSEGANLATSLASVSGTARRLLETKIEDLGQQLGCHEARLHEVEKALTALETAEADATWVATTIRDLDAVWDVMTPINRGRLIRALVESVEVDEPNSEVTATLIDLGLDGVADVDATPETASSMEA